MNESVKQLRVFGIVSGAAIGIMFGLVFPWVAQRSIPIWPWPVVVLLCICALIRPSLLRPLHRVMQAVGTFVFSVINWILLGVFYYLFLVPYSLVMRAAGKGEIERGFREDVDSYRIDLKKSNPIDLEKPF